MDQEGGGPGGPFTLLAYSVLSSVFLYTCTNGAKMRQSQVDGCQEWQP